MLLALVKRRVLLLPASQYITYSDIGLNLEKFKLKLDP